MGLSEGALPVADTATARNGCGQNFASDQRARNFGNRNRGSEGALPVADTATERNGSAGKTKEVKMGFDALLGNERLKENLRSSISRGRISHFYLISGPAGSGKRTLAKLLAASIFCNSIIPPKGYYTSFL